MSEKRKTTEENKDAQLHLRITKSDLALIKEKAAKLNMTVSDYVLFCTLNCDLNDRLDRIEKSVGGVLDCVSKG